MKIFFCDNRLGGLLGFRGDVINHMQQCGHTVFLVAPKPKSDWDKIGMPSLKDCNFIPIKMQSTGRNPIMDVFLFLQYFILFIKHRPDYIFNYTIKPNIYSSIAAKILGIKSTSMVAGLGHILAEKGFFKKFVFQLYKFGLDKTQYVLALNGTDYNRLIENHLVESKRLVLLSGGEGVNLLKYPYSPSNYSNGVIFIMISRLLYDKGYAEFIQAADLVSQYDSNVRFELLGPFETNNPTGVPMQVVQSDCDKYHHLNYLGVSDSSLPALSRPNVVVVLPSKYGEGLNRSLMEACAVGRPIITSDIPGCRETVVNNKNGYLISAGDIHQLSQAMIRFLQLPENEKQQMASFSNQIAKDKFDINKVIDTYDQIVINDISHIN